MPSSTTVSTVSGYPAVPEYLPDASEHRRQMARKINVINQGKFNCTIDVTLNPSTGATVIADNRIGYRTAVTPLMGLTPSGAAAIGAGMWCDNIMGGTSSTTATITVHHASSAAADQTIRFGIFG